MSGRGCAAISRAKSAREGDALPRLVHVTASTVSGGITNSGTITVSTSGAQRFAEGGALVGSVLGSGNTNGDVLNVTGGKIVLSGAQSISGFGTYNQSGGTLVFNVTSSTAAGTYPTLSAGTINLTGGTFELAPSGNLFALATQHTNVYKNVIVAARAFTPSLPL
jgi:hypothetical protein